MTSRSESGIPPVHVTTLLRLEGLAVFGATLAAYHLVGGNWWLFLILILAPDLAIFGYAAGKTTGARIYNFAHFYAAPIVLGPIVWLAGGTWALPVALIWIAHIGMDRALGYGLKYPGVERATHVGFIGKEKKAQPIADAG